MPSRELIAGLVTLAAALGGILTLGLPYLVRNYAPQRRLLWKSIVAAGWALLPPFWFWADYVFLFQSAVPEDFEAFRYGQELIRNIWLGFLLVVLLFYFKVTDVLSSDPGKTRKAGDPYYIKAER